MSTNPQIEACFQPWKKAITRWWDEGQGSTQGALTSGQEELEWEETLAWAQNLESPMSTTQPHNETRRAEPGPVFRDLSSQARTFESLLNALPSVLRAANLGDITVGQPSFELQPFQTELRPTYGFTKDADPSLRHPMRTRHARVRITREQKMQEVQVDFDQQLPTNSFTEFLRQTYQFLESKLEGYPNLLSSLYPQLSKELWSLGDRWTRQPLGDRWAPTRPHYYQTPRLSVAKETATAVVVTTFWSGWIWTHDDPIKLEPATLCFLGSLMPDGNWSATALDNRDACESVD